MPETRVQDEQGNIHVFPDGATPEMIAQALNVKPPSSGPTLTNQAPQQPGFSTMFGRTMGAPTSPEEAGGMLMGKSGQIEGASDSAYNPRGGVNLPGGFNPGNAAMNVFTNVGQSIADHIKSGSQQFGEAAQNIKAGGPILSNIGKGLSGYTDIISATNPVVNAGGESGKQFAEGNIPGGLGAFTAGMIQGGAMGRGMGVAEPPNLQSVSPRGALASRMAEVPAGGQFTRAELLQAAREKGITLDLAQITDHPIAKVIKKANEHSLTANSTYEANRTANHAALSDAATSEAAQYAPEAVDRSALGSKIQEKLKTEQQSQNDQAGKLLDDITKRVGNSQPDAANIYDAAQNIIGQEKSYYAKNPSLKPGRAFEIVKSIADRASKLEGETKVIRSSRTDANGNPLMRKVQMPPTIQPDTWSDLHKLRTDVMNEYRSPDIVGTRAEGWLKQLVGVIDNTMTSEAASKLSPVDVEKFRQANKIYADMKDTFDNPQSPFYHAIRSRAPESVPGMLSKGVTLSGKARQLIGDLEGPLQRRFVEDLIASKDGVTPDFKNLNTKIKRTPNDQLVAVLGAKGARSLRMLGELSSKVTADANPSGTAKVGQPAAELAGTLHNPVLGGAELLTQYGAGKAMHSVSLADYLTQKMRKPGATPPNPNGPIGGGQTPSLSDLPEKWELKTRSRVDNQQAYKPAGSFGAYSIERTTLGDMGRLVAIDRSGNVVGDLTFGDHTRIPGHLEGAVEVKPTARRGGIATALYQKAEALTGKKFRPSLPHTQAAEALWNNPKRGFGE